MTGRQCPAIPRNRQKDLEHSAEGRYTWTIRTLSKTAGKELKAAIDEWRSIRKVAGVITSEHMEDGKGIIHVKMKDIYDPISMGNLLQLNGSIFDYIENVANILPSMIPLRIVMHGVDEKDRKKVAELYKMHYELDVQDHLWDQRVNNIKTIYLTVLGVLIVAAGIVFAIIGKHNLLLEILSIIGSYALCEAAGCFVIQRREINRDLYETAQFLTAEIVFEDKDE